MSTTGWIILAVVVVVLIVAAIVIASARRRRRAQLQQRFGSEYDRTLSATGDRRSAERDLRDRADRRDAFELHEIEPARRHALVGEWVGVQASFVDDPAAALRSAARLVHNAMTERGYPDGRASDDIDLVSVDYPDVVPEFRRAHETIQRLGDGAGNTEALRCAVLQYRSVFDRMLEPTRAEAAESTR